MDFVSLICRLALAIIFLFAAAGKTITAKRWRSFVTATAALTDTGSRTAYVLSVTTLAAELAVCSLLLTTFDTPIGPITALLLLAALSAALTRAIVRDTSQPCHCFGSTDEPVGIRHLVRNGVLAVVAGFALHGSTVPTTLSLPDLLAAALPGMALTAVVTYWDELADAIYPRPKETL